MSRWPDFIIIGAMKCATSTLHEQLARQDGIVMSDPKEPCFFSDDAIWARGSDWYRGLFARAGPADLCGESSTHYTKRPTHRRTVERMKAHLPATTRFVYVMRHPIDRLVSQYVHEWTQRRTTVPIDEAVEQLPELVDYGRYAMQLRPFIDAFGVDAILPVFLERMRSEPQEQLERVARFVGYGGAVRWDDGLDPQNVSAERERSSRLRRTLSAVPGARPLLHAVVPDALWERLKTRLWRMPGRPELSAGARARLERVYDEDLAELGRWLGLELSCATFARAVQCPGPTWRRSAGASAP
ncbi:MAG: sulfotransferase family protein, partial [Planctomycetota bacterium]